eukprot:764880-Hanusia_phi.AAC.5
MRARKGSTMAVDSQNDKVQGKESYYSQLNRIAQPSREILDSSIHPTSSSSDSVSNLTHGMYTPKSSSHHRFQ